MCSQYWGEGGGKYFVCNCSTISSLTMSNVTGKSVKIPKKYFWLSENQFSLRVNSSIPWYVDCQPVEIYFQEILYTFCLSFLDNIFIPLVIQGPQRFFKIIFIFILWNT